MIPPLKVLIQKTVLSLTMSPFYQNNHLQNYYSTRLTLSSDRVLQEKLTHTHKKKLHRENTVYQHHKSLLI